MKLRVRELREERGWNQTILGYHAGLSASQISLIETGKRNPSAETLQGIATALGVEVGDLFPKAPAPSPEILEGGEWERRRSRIVGLTLEATALRKGWTKELQEGGLAEHRAMEISFAIKGVLESAKSQTLLGGLENTDKANAQQVKRLREELERLAGLLELSVEQVTTGLHFKSIIDGVVFEQGRATPVETGKKNHA